MENRRRDRLILITVGSLFVLIVVYTSRSRSQSTSRPSLQPLRTSSSSADASLLSSLGTSLAKHDLGLERTLTERECEDAYPGLFYELERSEEFYRKKRGKVTMDEIGAPLFHCFEREWSC